MSRRKHQGLTLIEVLIALGIVGIALTAAIKATSQTIRSTDYIKQKTMATWIGQELLNEARLGLINLPTETHHLADHVTKALGRKWFWQAKQEETPNNHIKRIEVSVFAKETREEDESPLVNLQSYVYRAG